MHNMQKALSSKMRQVEKIKTRIGSLPEFQFKRSISIGPVTRLLERLLEPNTHMTQV
jgi:hypothetical protein